MPPAAGLQPFFQSPQASTEFQPSGPAPPPDIRQALAQAAQFILTPWLQQLLGDPAAGASPEERQYLDMATGGMPMGLMSKGRAATTFGSDAMEMLRGLMRSDKGRGPFPRPTGALPPEAMDLARRTTQPGMFPDPMYALSPDDIEAAMPIFARLPEALMQHAIAQPETFGQLLNSAAWNLRSPQVFQGPSTMPMTLAYNNMLRTLMRQAPSRGTPQ